jgi:hypothetical protein
MKLPLGDIFPPSENHPRAKVDTFEVEVIALTLNYSTGTLNYLYAIFFHLQKITLRQK